MVIPDPTDPQGLGIDDNGHLVRQLWGAPINADGTPPTMEQMQPLGWIRGIEFTYEED